MAFPLSILSRLSKIYPDQMYRMLIKPRIEKPGTVSANSQGDLEESGSNSENINIFDWAIFLIIVKGLSPFPPFHDYQKYIPVK